MLLLELFSGTGSWGKVFRKHGVDVISVDKEAQFKPTIVIDIRELDYKKLPTPDIITASPPCNSFSTLGRAGRLRDWYTLEPLHPNAVEGEELLYKTIEIIRYFLKKNPNLRFVIENPTAMMRNMPIMNRLPRQTTEYCLYGFPWRKKTDFFSNFRLNLKDPLVQKKCDTARLIPVVEIPREERYKIPPRLIEKIYQSFLHESPLHISLNKNKPTIRIRP
jgi:site-specific DNA-cytosine methylase